jgi:hypothetical protein
MVNRFGDTMSGPLTLNSDPSEPLHAATKQYVDMSSTRTIPVYWSELIGLKHDQMLTPGQSYRIKDYVTTTTSDNTQSAEHPFDIVVTALDESTLSENAKAIQPNGDIPIATCSITFNNGEDDLVLIRDIWSDWLEEHLYAWYSIDDGNTYYTDNMDVNVGDSLYDGEGNDTGFTVTSTEIYGFMIYHESDNWYEFYMRYPESDSAGNSHPYAYMPESLKEVVYLDDEVPVYGADIYDVPGPKGMQVGTITHAFTPENTYFLNSNLDAWELKYCIDNDTNRFAWADSENGKGVIYYMKDEWNNECPYDFKNIQFKRWAIEEYTANPALVVDGEGNDYGYYYGAMQFDGETQTIQTATYGENYGWFYTFALKDIETGDWYDYTVVAHIGLKNDEGVQVGCYDNHISPATDEYNSGNGELAKMLNDIVFFNSYTDISNPEYSDVYSYCNNNRFDGNCYDNTFGNDCYSNTFGNYFRFNSFGNDCNGNTFGNDCYSNTFGNDCYSNTFGNYFRFNSFGNDCYNNTFGNGCYRNTFFGNGYNFNTFGNYCYSNTFGNSCSTNTFGNYCYSNTFGNSCSTNTFGNGCYSNTFGNDCNFNTFGNYCYSNTFGNSCSGNTFGNGCIIIQFSKNYTYYCIVESGNQNITLTSTQRTSSSDRLRNITIAQGVNNTTTTKTISHNTVNDTFQTVYKSVDSQIVFIL